MKVCSVSLDTRTFFENVLLFVDVSFFSEGVFIHEIGICTVSGGRHMGMIHGG